MTPNQPRPHELAPGSNPALEAQGALEILQAELDELRREVGLLRSRDESLGFYMQKLDEEMRLAARIQQDFLPRRLPQFPAVRFTALFRPAGYVSGDIYDILRVDEDHVGLYIADAVGHGMPAALLTMFLKNALQTKEIQSESYRLLRPSESIGRLNSALSGQDLSFASFATAIYGLLDVNRLTFTFARGGHPPPLLQRGDAPLVELVAEGSLLGVFPDERFEDVTVQLAPGDRLILHTDGLESVFLSSEGPDLLRWRRELDERRQLSTPDLLADLERMIDEQAGSLTPKDDLTIVIVDVSTP
jgi:sigma-B regulation protein RsbU (phosphoserine phosphatase)